MKPKLLKIPRGRQLRRPQSGYTVHMVQEKYLPCVSQDKLETVEDVQAFLSEHLPKLPHNIALAVVRHEGR